MVCVNCESTDVISVKKMRRVNGKQIPFRKMSYGKAFIRHTCNKCQHTWDIE